MTSTESALPAHSDPGIDALWRELVEIHNHAKSLFILAEERDPELRDFLQPVMEQRHALEHIMRARGCDLGMINERQTGDRDYIRQSLRKAIGHEFRAFFDACDWFQLSLRQKLTEDFGRYSNACLSAVAPDYYRTIRPRMEALASEIASIRTRKDIAKNETLNLVREYRQIVDELTRFSNQSASLIPALEEWTAKQANDDAAKHRRDIVGKFLVGIAIFILGLLARGLFGI